MSFRANMIVAKLIWYSPRMNQPQDGWIGRSCFHSRPLTFFGGSRYSTTAQVLCVSFDPRANDILAASCMSGQILFWNVVSAQTVGSIDGLRDIQTARHWHEMFSAINTRGVKTGRGMRKRNLPVMSQWCVIGVIVMGSPIGHSFLCSIAANRWCLAHLLVSLVQEIPRMASTWTSTTIPLPTPRAARSWSPLRRIRPMSHSMCPGAKDLKTPWCGYRNGKVIDPMYCQVVVVYEPHQLPIYAP